MLIKFLKNILKWCKELWELLKVVADIHPNTPTYSYSEPVTKKTQRPNVLHNWQSGDRSTEVARHRYIEVDGYAENFRIDRLGRYDLLQIERFCENLVYISPDAINDFIDETIYYKRSIIDGEDVLWVPKGDCIEWAYHQYPAFADLL
ncbi:hypothetical protein [Thalassotalea sp. PS06]|uniref:hypothetical protein n=1 Tax=Thalassotalea sp. PS06 TaxID=2594005 RepID=UPI001162A03D|nr:hypothetical protein [Thalassotalea sp. PS06]QDP02199.1 hypothetical protein FNC98_13120 [Thalassotalea sp. PS06]